jgi:hypothetical protein
MNNITTDCYMYIRDVAHDLELLVRLELDSTRSEMG